MNQTEAKKIILDQLSKKRGKIVGKNIVSAAFSLFTNPVESVEKLFLGVNSETEDEKLKLEQELMLDLICQISESVQLIQDKYNSEYNGKSSILIDGLIQVKAENSENVIGVHIKENSKQVEFKPGTKITVDSRNSRNTTGLKIGGE